MGSRLSLSPTSAQGAIGEFPVFSLLSGPLTLITITASQKRTRNLPSQHQCVSPPVPLSSFSYTCWAVLPVEHRCLGTKFTIFLIGTLLPDFPFHIRTLVTRTPTTAPPLLHGIFLASCPLRPSHRCPTQPDHFPEQLFPASGPGLSWAVRLRVVPPGAWAGVSGTPSVCPLDANPSHGNRCVSDSVQHLRTDMLQSMAQTCCSFQGPARARRGLPEEFLGRKRCSGYYASGSSFPSSGVLGLTSLRLASPSKALGLSAPAGRPWGHGPGWDPSPTTLARLYPNTAV